MKQLVVNADDFGFDAAVNAAVVRAHTAGVLTSASLMVAAPHAEEAFAIAKAHPELGVGVHLCIVQNRAAAPVAEIPSLADARGDLPRSPFALSMRLRCDPRLLVDIRTEFRAQMVRFLASGLQPSHLDTHLHTHMDPRVLGVVIDLGREYGVPFVRAPFEPIGPSLRCAFERLPFRIARFAVFGPMGIWTRHGLRRAGLRTADVVFGALDSGHVTVDFVRACIARLRDGVSEIFSHPATETTPALARVQPGYQHCAELEALCSPEIRRAIESAGIRLTNYRALAAVPAR